LPYQPALFLEILSNLRNQLSDATKSIFSGTARAILSLVDGLRTEWAEKDGSKPVVSLVDFYDLVQYELKDIIPGQTEVIEHIKEDDATTEFDLKVAKAVLLLSYVPEMVPQTHANIATAVMDDLDGQTRANVQMRVKDSLEGNLEKYIRPDTSTDGAKLRLTDREEQELISKAREHEANPEWDEILTELDEQLWEEIIADLELPQSYEWDSDSEDEDTAYAVGYSFEIDGHSLETAQGDDPVFDIDVAVRGLHPDVDDDHIAPDTLYWRLDTEGIEEIRDQLVEWWALVSATRRRNPPESVVRDRQDAADRVSDKLRSALSNGEFRVEADRFTAMQPALEAYIDEAYPAYFHPELSRIDESHLSELKQLDDDEDLPTWAQTIGVPQQATTDFATFSDIAFKLRGLIGSQIQDSDDNVDLATILDRIADQEPLLARETSQGQEPAPATLAVLWGLCRAGVFRPTTVTGEPVPLEAILDTSQHTQITLSILPVDNPKDVFVEYDIITPTESGNQGYLNFDETLEDLAARANALADDARVKADTTFETPAVTTLVENLVTEAEAIERAVSDRQERAMTDNTDELRDLIEATDDDEDVLEMAETHWENRLPFLLQLEGLARLNTAAIAWFDEGLQSDIERLTEQLAETSDTEWWTDDGWGTFVSDLDTRTDVIDALDDAWVDRQSATELDVFIETLADHPWLIPPSELPHGVHTTFQAEYLDPLRTFRTTVERIRTVMTALTDPEPSETNETTLTQAIGHLDGRIDWTAVTDETFQRNRTRQSTLDDVVGDKTPKDVVGIGFLPDDGDGLESQVLALDADDGVPQVEEVDDGVIIR
jgi:hypothetical protein